MIHSDFTQGRRLYDPTTAVVQRKIRVIDTGTGQQDEARFLRNKRRLFQAEQAQARAYSKQQLPVARMQGTTGQSDSCWVYRGGKRCACRQPVQVAEWRPCLLTFTCSSSTRPWPLSWSVWLRVLAADAACTSRRAAVAAFVSPIISPRRRDTAFWRESGGSTRGPLDSFE